MRWQLARCTASSVTMREAGLRCGLRDSAALNLRRRIAADLIEFFGEEEIRRLLNGMRLGWPPAFAITFFALTGSLADERPRHGQGATIISRKSKHGSSEERP